MRVSLIQCLAEFQQKPLPELMSSRALSRSNVLARPKSLNFRILRLDETLSLKSHVQKYLATQA